MSSSLALAARKHLQTVILPFWEGLKDDANGGYYGYMGYDLALDKQAPKGCILNSRLLWTFSTASVALNDKSLLSYAKQAYDFMPRFEDKEFGGLYWMLDYQGSPKDTMKHTYCQAFAVYGLCAYAKATGEQEPIDRAMKLYNVMESKMRDERGYLEAFQRDYSPADNKALSDAKGLVETNQVAMRTMNTTLHVMEAYTQLYLVTHDKAVLGSLYKLMNVMQTHIYSKRNRRQEVFFDLDWRSLIDMQSYGHDIESSWLICETAQAIGDEKLIKAINEIALDLAASVYERAFTGEWLDNESDRGENDPKRIWWVEAETVVGFFNAYQLSGEEKYLSAAQKVFHNIEEKFVDKRKGSEWYWCLTADGAPIGQPIVEPWKCPYHNSRMCMELMDRAK